MSHRDKALRHFLSRPADFRFDEMNRMLKDLGYEEIRSGKTSGSRVAFLNRENGHIIRLHRPHPGNIVKRYQMELVEDALRAKGAIK